MQEASEVPAVRMQQLRKSYHRGNQEVPVLNGIDLVIEAGAFVALVGPSGSGKSTLLNLIAGLDQPSGGDLEVFGQELSVLSEGALARWRASHVGFIFQFYNLLPVLNALENVELPLLLTGLSRRERREHALAALSMVGLSDRLTHYPSQLSGGQQQRVAIARAVVTDPLLLVADEPTGDLDRASAEEVLAMLEELNEALGKTIIMVTHDNRAAQRARRRIHLDKGELREGADGV